MTSYAGWLLLSMMSYADRLRLSMTSYRGGRLLSEA